LQRLIELAKKKKTAIMCAEAVPWRCHRSLIADALTVRGIRAAHIVSGKRVRVHTLIPFGRVRGDRITYPAIASEGPESLHKEKALKEKRLARGHREPI
jgi:hypothetical protein